MSFPWCLGVAYGIATLPWGGICSSAGVSCEPAAGDPSVAATLERCEFARLGPLSTAATPRSKRPPNTHTELRAHSAKPSCTAAKPHSPARAEPSPRPPPLHATRNEPSENPAGRWSPEGPGRTRAPPLAPIACTAAAACCAVPTPGSPPNYRAKRTDGEHGPVRILVPVGGPS